MCGYRRRRSQRCGHARRRDGETLNALLKRLDKAIGKFYDNDEIVDEINGL